MRSMTSGTLARWNNAEEERGAYLSHDQRHFVPVELVVDLPAVAQSKAASEYTVRFTLVGANAIDHARQCPQCMIVCACGPAYAVFFFFSAVSWRSTYRLMFTILPPDICKPDNRGNKGGIVSKRQ